MPVHLRVDAGGVNGEGGKALPQLLEPGSAAEACDHPQTRALHPQGLQAFQNGDGGGAAGENRQKHQQPHPLTDGLRQVVEVPVGRFTRPFRLQAHMGHPGGGKHRASAIPEAQAAPQHRNGKQGHLGIDDAPLAALQRRFHLHGALGQPVAQGFVGKPAAKLAHRRGEKR